MNKVLKISFESDDSLIFSKYFKIGSVDCFFCYFIAEKKYPFCFVFVCLVGPGNLVSEHLNISSAQEPDWLLDNSKKKCFFLMLAAKVFSLKSILLSPVTWHAQSFL